MCCLSLLRDPYIGRCYNFWRRTEFEWLATYLQPQLLKRYRKHPNLYPIHCTAGIHSTFYSLSESLNSLRTIQISRFYRLFFFIVSLAFDLLIFLSLLFFGFAESISRFSIQDNSNNWGPLIRKSFTWNILKALRNIALW